MTKHHNNWYNDKMNALSNLENIAREDMQDNLIYFDGRLYQVFTKDELDHAKENGDLIGEFINVENYNGEDYYIYQFYK